VRRRRSDQELLELLRKSHSADLPPDVEERFQREFARFRTRLRNHGNVAEPGAVPRPSEIPIWTGWRAAAALTALVMTILGAALEPVGATGGLEAPLELWQQRARVLSNLGRVVVMEARIEGRAPAGRPASELVWWLPGRPVRMEGRDASESTQDPLNAVRLSLGPPELIRTLSGGWRVGRSRGVQAAREFVVQPPGGLREILVTVDPVGGLPVSMADPANRVVVHFRWTARLRGSSVLLHRTDRQ
jgi:hypothetical protein